MIPCALCEVEIGEDDEPRYIELSQNAIVVMHEWCMEIFLQRVVFLPTAESDQRDVVDVDIKGEQL